MTVWRWNVQVFFISPPSGRPLSGQSRCNCLSSNTFFGLGARRLLAVWKPVQLRVELVAIFPAGIRKTSLQTIVFVSMVSVATLCELLECCQTVTEKRKTKQSKNSTSTRTLQMPCLRCSRRWIAASSKIMRETATLPFTTFQHLRHEDSFDSLPPENSGTAFFCSKAHDFCHA